MDAQPGIFALGTPEHCYLEFELTDAGATGDVVRRAAELVMELSTAGGINVVVGFRPELWAAAADAADIPADAHGWSEPVVGPDGFTMPATQRDVWLWLSGGNRTVIFDAGRRAVQALHPFARPAGEVTGWLYRHDRDLTGFVDGTENPSLLEASKVVAVPDGAPGAGSSVVLHQLWRHESAAWDAASQEVQEQVIGRTKDDSVELPEDAMPADSHVSRTVLEVDGVELPIFRRNVAYGGVTDHGTVFVGFSADQWRLAEMLRRMTGIPDGVRCALTRYTTPLTGAYYVVPSVQAIMRFVPADPA